MPGAEQLVHGIASSLYRQWNVVRRQVRHRLLGWVQSLFHQTIVIPPQLILGPVDQRLRGVLRRASCEAPRFQFAKRRGDPLAHVRMEAEDEFEITFRCLGGPDFWCRGHLQDAAKTQSLIADASVRVLRALSELA